MRHRGIGRAVLLGMERRRSTRRRKHDGSTHTGRRLRRSECYHDWSWWFVDVCNARQRGLVLGIESFGPAGQQLFVRDIAESDQRQSAFRQTVADPGETSFVTRRTSADPPHRFERSACCIGPTSATRFACCGAARYSHFSRSSC